MDWKHRLPAASNDGYIFETDHEVAENGDTHHYRVYYHIGGCEKKCGKDKNLKA